MSFKTGEKKEDKDRTIAGKLDEWGIHAYTDREFMDRRDNIFTELSGFITDADIEARTDWTDRKKTMAKMAQKKLRFVWYHGPSGKGADNGKFYRAMSACRNIVTRVMESLDCDASDDDLWLNNMDRLATLDKIIMATFGRENTSVTKAFVVQQPPTFGGGAPILDQDTKDAMLEAARQRNAKP